MSVSATVLNDRERRFVDIPSISDYINNEEWNDLIEERQRSA